VRRYIVRRLLTMIPTVFAVSIVTFSITFLLPGDPALAILGQDQARDRVAYETLRRELGLDRPIPVQYLDWAGKALRGDLGISIRTREPVLQGILQRLPATLVLGFVALALALAIGVPLGVLSAVRANSRADIVGTIFAMSGVAVPSFWLGIMLIFLLSVWLRLLPPSGFVSPTQDPLLSLKLLAMPAFTLATAPAAVIMRQVRSSVIDVMRNDYIVTARAKGVRELTVLWRHALANALLPVLSIIGLQVGRILGGAVVVETIFSIPGLGRLTVDSIFTRDFPAVQGVVLVLSVTVLLANLATDILYAYADPRIKYG